MIGVSRASKKMVAKELLIYHQTKRDIQRRRNDIIHAGKVQQEGGRVGVSNPTLSTVTRLDEDKHLRYLEEIVEAIDDVVDALDHEHKKLVKLLYWTKPQLLTWDGIALEVNLSKRQAQNWNTEILEAIAIRMGWR